MKAVNSSRPYVVKVLNRNEYSPKDPSEEFSSLTFNEVATFVNVVSVNIVIVEQSKEVIQDGFEDFSRTK